ncbi:DUF5819 family protein [Paenibacillus sp. P36]|uniref:DUF5819 family protein n=1 Tax=Paenibacillus sp. P36 TaxID=3342538 RepID=UPI0038B31D44
MRYGLYRSIVLLVILISLGIFFFFHFSMILLHVCPVNPISTRYKIVTDSYTQLFFAQNWHLFAPDPISTNYYVYMDVRYYGESLKKDEKEINWIDITTPMIDVNNKSFFTPYNRLLRINNGLVSQLQLNLVSDLTMKVVKKNLAENTEEKVNQSLMESHENAKDGLYRYAYSYAKTLFPNQKIEAIKLLVCIKETIPFSKRNDTNFQKDENRIILDWRDNLEDVIALP